MKMSPEYFISIAWSLPLGNYVVESSTENLAFVSRVIAAGRRKGILCLTINLSSYNDVGQAFSSVEGDSINRVIEGKSKQSIIHFESADVLAANDKYTFWLRTALEIERYTTGNVIPIFSLTQNAIEAMFLDVKAPFYQSHFSF
jgi:hypothetical protein